MRHDDGTGAGRTVGASSGGEAPRVSRSTFLKGAAGAVLGAGTVLGGMGTAAASRTSRSPRSKGPVASKVRDLTGPEETGRFRMAAADRGIPVQGLDGRLLFVFGDAWERPRALTGGWWRSPVALWSDTTKLDEGVTWSGAVGGKAARQLWPYDHPNRSTALPTDVIRIDGTLYMFVAVCDPHPRVSFTEILRSHDNGASWTHTHARFPGALHGGRFQMPTWAEGDDGWVYVFSTGFQRDKPIILSRVPRDRITDPRSYRTWGHRNGRWSWGNPPTPVVEGRYGELCLRPIGGKWVLTWLSLNDGVHIDGTLLDAPTSDLAGAYRRPLINGCDWGQEGGDRVAQPYGGYIIPGSTLADLHLSVSQWNTRTNWPYRVMQHRVSFSGT